MDLKAYLKEKRSVVENALEMFFPEPEGPAADVVKAIALGADAVYIGTAALIALGCHVCQQCHTVAGHPSVAYNPSGLPGGGGGGSAFLLAGSCTNCHSQVHGSNHPSGVKLMR